MAPLRAAGVRVVVLGCTHYPLLRPLLQEELGPRVALIDSGAETARVVEEVLRRENLAAAPGTEGRHRFAVSDDAPRFLAVGSRFIGERLAEAEIVPLG